MKPRVYIACRTTSRALGVDIARAALSRGLVCASKWLFRVESDGPDGHFSDNEAAEIQRENIADLDDSTHLLLIATEPLRGAAFECGYMLGRGKSVHAVGSWRDASTLMIFDARVTWHANIEDALRAITGSGT